MASTGFDSLDNTTGLRPPSLFRTDYAKNAIGGSLQGLRFGLLEGMFHWTPSNEITPVNDVMNYMISVLQKAGVEIVPITETLYNCTELSSLMGCSSL
jgi:Asp-tRNA(Asn)/Glu-tRNA(Gln) amidotransferase A subunit family amidase